MSSPNIYFRDEITETLVEKPKVKIVKEPIIEKPTIEKSWEDNNKFEE